MSEATTSRRDFMKKSTAAAIGTAVVSQTLSTGVYAAGSDTLKVGLIGCGSRGTGAAVQALHADKGAKLVAMGDLFADQIKTALGVLTPQDVAPQIDVPADRQFSGWDNYKGVIEHVDVVLLATTPHFRPIQLEAAINAGKHIFCEKPVGVDAPSVRKVMELSAAAKNKNLNLVSGLCYRYDKYKQETIKRIHDGALGEIISLQPMYLTTGLWSKPRQPGWSDMEWQIRNWLYFTWLSGDHIVEQHIHSLDKALWVMKDEPPVRVEATGGRIQRVAPQYGNVYDHFNTIYEWKNGVRAYSNCRQWNECRSDVADWVLGSEGIANVQLHTIKDRKGKTKFHKGENPENMYDSEHKALFGAIRSGNVINNGDYMCKSTLMAIMARESAYSGQPVTWEQIMASDKRLVPAQYAFGPAPEVVIAVPGTYKLEAENNNA